MVSTDYLSQPTDLPPRSPTVSGEKAFARQPSQRIRAVSSVQPPIGRTKVRLDLGAADAEMPTDAPGGLPAGHQLQDLALPLDQSQMGAGPRRRQLLEVEPG